MPTYAYACKDCSHAFDIQQAFSDDSLTVCPECRGTLRKKFNSVGVVFKGSGFYRTDSRDSKGSTLAAPTGEGKAAANTGSTGSGSAAATSDSGTTADSSKPAASGSAAKTPATVAG